jgi:hypothetical protein
VRARKGGRGRLGREVGNDFRISGPSKEVAQHAVLVAAIEDTKGAGLAADESKERLVRRVVPDRFHALTLHSMAVCDQP